MRRVHWIGDTKKMVRSFPEEVRQEVGFTIFLAQKGDKALNAVPLVGFKGAKVLEAIIDDSGNTYRAVYTVKFKEAVYVLHAFQKKSNRGIKTPKPDMQLISMRLRSAELHYRKHYDGATKKESADETRERHRRGSD